ncbi:MAG: hypothetical protein K2O18_06125 [Oscillospiraceae bacterium]|nr:hypothetical protein [Oscillospiraceae bacterium]
MALFLRDDEIYHGGGRPTGFARYQQLLSERFGRWWKVNLLTLLGCLPLALGIFYAVGTSSLLVLYPCSLAGGMIAGPFLAGMYDAVLRGLRDDHLPWRDAYVRSWKQNWKSSIAMGAVMGLLLGQYVFMGMLFWWAERAPGWTAVLVYLLGLLLLLTVNTLLWPQVVLFEQKWPVRMRNAALFCLLNFWRVLGAGLLQLGYLAVFVLFAPWSLLLLPVVGLWYIVFLSQFLIYERMDDSFQIEELYGELES